MLQPNRNSKLVANLPACFVFVATLVFWPGFSVAGGGPENVAVIVNAQSSSSKLIANHYVNARKIPSRNVILLSDVPKRERTTFNDFRDKILVPILQELKARKIDTSIDYIVYSSDFPTTVQIKDHQQRLFEAAKKQFGIDKMPNATLYHSWASITSITYFAAAALAGDPSFMMLDANPYFRKPAGGILSQPFIGVRKQQYDRAVGAFESGPGPTYDAAIKSLEELARANPSQVAVTYWLARFYAKLGKVNESAKWLAESARNGWVFRDQTSNDPAFEKVKDESLFAGILQHIPNTPFRNLSTCGFKNQRIWAPNGMINGEPGQGRTLYLSTVLATTRNFGTTEREALDQVLASVKADESRPNGTFYFCVGGGRRNTPRRPGVAPAVETLRAMGLKAEMIKTFFPKNKRDVVGLLTGKENFKLDETGIKILPGAICENLTSFGGRLGVPGQTKLSEFIRHGAAGSSGTVIEPYALQAKFPDPMIHVHYARGCSLAESFYQSVHGPFQLLIVGDALCQPWAVKPVISVDGLTRNQEVKGQVSLALDTTASPVPISHIELYIDGVLAFRNRLVSKFDFDTSGLSDGYHELRVVGLADDQIQSSGNSILPFVVNNKDQQVQVECRRRNWRESEDVELTVESNCGDVIQLTCNMQLLEEKPIGDDGKVAFSIPARQLGRGPILLEAIARSEKDGLTVSSLPLPLEIDGPISRIKPQTERPPAKPPAKASKASTTK